MLAVILIQSVPDKNLSWILYILLGLFLFVIIVGVIASHEKKEPAPSPEQEAMKSIRKTPQASSRKKANK
jgi:uncharacterized protein YpmB